MKATILIVDDDDDLREVLVDLLSGAGYDVVAAAGGREALRALGAGARVDLILLDLMMPEMNGWEFRRAQLGDPALAAIPVVVTTANRSLHALPIDAREVLYKPFSAEQLLRRIEAVLGA